MNAFYKISGTSIFLVTTAFASIQITDNLPMLVCPDVNQLQVNIMAGQATAPGGWSGESGIPLANKDNWRNTIDQIDAENELTENGGDADCSYFSNVSDGFDEIIDIKKPLPQNYQLYDVNSGVQPLGNCWIPQSQVNSGENKECYWYSNPVK